MKKRILSVLLVFLFVLSTPVYAYQNNKYYSNIKIGLQSMESGTISVLLNGSYTVGDQTLPQGTAGQVSISNGKISFNGNLYDALTFTPVNSGTTIKLSTGSGTNIFSRQYLGSMTFTITASNDILPINSLNIEDYLKGVVGIEMSNSYPLAALEAQAIAARNYAIANLGKYGNYGYDLSDGVDCQAYKGYDPNDQNVIQAVNNTKGIVLLDNDNLVWAYYAASDGGYTEASQNVWISQIDYLKSKQDTFDNYVWPAPITFTSLALGNKLKQNGILSSTDTFEKIDLSSITKYTSGRVSNITIYYKDNTGVEHTISFSKEGARIFLNLPSSMYDVTYDQSTDTYTFTGKGNGHGVGMSQIGAKNRALNGQSFSDILTFYYDGTYLASLLAKISSFDVNGSYLFAGKGYTLSTTSSSPNTVLYSYFVEDLSTGTWTQLSNNTTDSTFVWTPQKAGQYELVVHIKDQYSTNNYDDYTSKVVTVNPPVAKLMSMNADNSVTIPGRADAVTANAVSPNQPMYEFWVEDLNAGTSVKAQAYSTNNVFNWTPDKTGSFRIITHVKDSLSQSSYEDYSYKDVSVVQPVAKAVSIDASQPLAVNQKSTITANATSTTQAMYEFWVENVTTGNWTKVQAYSTNNTYTWTPTTAGNYRIVVHVKDAASQKAYDDYIYKDFTIASPTAKATSLSVNSNPAINQPSVITAAATSTTGALYEFWVENVTTGNWTKVQAYSTNNTYTWTPTTAGSYRIVVHVKDAASIRAYDDYMYKDFTIASPTAKVTSLNVNTNQVINQPDVITAAAASTTGALYEFWVENAATGNWTKVQAYSANNSYTWMPTTAGNYEIVVHVKDAASIKSYDDYSYKNVSVVYPSAKVTSFNVNLNPSVNQPNVVTTTASAVTSPLYQFWISDLSTGTWSMVQDYSSNSSYTWTPAKAGNYEVVVHVKDKLSSKNYDDYAYKVVTAK